jgi:hypothetical protein
MNIVIEFGDDETKDAEIALNGWKWKMIVWDLDQLLRSTTKHGVSLLDSKKEASNEEVEIAYKIRDQIREMLSESSLNLED